MYLGSVARDQPDRPAVIMGSTGDVVTYRELDERSNRLAHLFRARGLAPGDCMAIFMENQARFMEVTWAAIRAGLYCTPINSHLTAPEVEYIVDDCEARLLVSSKRLAPVCAEMSPGTVPRVESRLIVDGVIPGWESYEEAIAGFPPDPIGDECEGGFAFYSSGTTGRPKGILRPLSFAPMGEGPDPLTAFFSWCGFFVLWIYSTPVVAIHDFGGAAPGTPAYHEAGRWVGVLFAVYNGVAAVYAFLLPALAGRFGRERVHAANLIAGAAGFAALWVIRDPQSLPVAMVGIGMAWASVLTMPYALLCGALPYRKLGVYMGIFNFFIVLPQLVIAGVMGTIVRIALPGDPAGVMVIAGTSLLLAAALSWRRFPQ